MDTSSTELLITVYGAILALGILITMLANLWFRVHIYPFERETAPYQLDLVRQQRMAEIISEMARLGFVSDDIEADEQEAAEANRSRLRVDRRLRIGRWVAIGLSVIFVLLLAVVPVVAVLTLN